MKKGIGTWLKILIGIVVAVFVIWIFFLATNPITDISESRQTQTAAYLLTDALNDVYTNAYVLKDHDYNVTINITLPNKGDTSWFSSATRTDRSPKWVIYHGYNSNDIKIIKYYHVLDDKDQPCFDKVCFGFVRRTERSSLSLISPANVEKFWLLNPCQATINVYYDSVSSLVKLKFQSADGFCCDENDANIINRGWPDGGKAKTNECSFQ